MGLVLIACTTFLLGQDAALVVGKSYDWAIGDGQLVSNKRGVAKKALRARPADPPLTWVSKHASLTFNQYGRELPNGGMNDAGLVVEIMWLTSEAPPVDQRPTVSELQVIQWWLDSFGSTAELVAHAKEVRISPIYGRVHYLACDKGGQCAALEHVEGKLVITPGVKALANHTYAESHAFEVAHHGQLPEGPGSLERFTRVSTLQARPEPDLPKQAFSMLDRVRDPKRSQWNIVYEPGRARIWFRTLHEPRIRYVDLAAFPPSCTAPVEVLDIDYPGEGDVRKAFRPWTEAANQALLDRSLKPLRDRLPPALPTSGLAHYPALQSCTLAASP
jgi:choloylglycine hydrolase